MFDQGDDLLVFKDDVIEKHETEPTEPWRVLIVDDEEVVHNTTRLVLHDFVFENRHIEFLSAYSSAEAKEVLEENNDIAVVFLDVVMEDEDAGLRLVKYIREVLENKLIRIILRTGQPGQAPEDRVIIDYDINDYKTKTELTVQKMFTSLVSALRTYKDLIIIEKNRQGLQKIVEASNSLFEISSLKRFTAGLIMQMISMYGFEDEAIYFRKSSSLAATKKNGHLIVLAGCGEFEELINQSISEVADEEIVACIEEAEKEQRPIFRGNIFVGYYKSLGEIENYIVFKGVKEISEIDKELMMLFSTNISLAFDNVYLNERIVKTQKEVIYRLGEVVESRSQDTANHVRRVAEIAYLVAKKVGLDEQAADTIKMAAPMHDIGKIGISENVLNKPGKLTDEEFSYIKTHTDIGYRILRDSKLILMDSASEIAKSHHENWDGSGYPKGLKGEEIPMGARIVAIADVFDSLCHKRCYKEPWPVDEAVEYIQKQKGIKFDPDLVDAFVEHIEEVEKIMNEMAD